jgi:hypothetical protein
MHFVVIDAVKTDSREMQSIFLGLDEAKPRRRALV